jgi:hypothetical protein
MLRIWTALYVAAMALVPMVPFALKGGGWPKCHDSARYLVLFDHFREQIAGGVLYPRWLPELYGGLGYPTFVYYQPGYFYWQLPFAQLTDNPLWTPYFSLYALLLCGAAGMWLLCRWAFSSRAAAAAGVALFMLTPYLFADLYSRCDLSEFMALVLTPWPLALALRLKARLAVPRPRFGLHVTAFAIAIAVVVLAHPVALMFVVPFLIVFVIWTGRDAGKPARGRFYALSAVGLVAGLALTAPYWLSAYLMTPHVGIDAVNLGPKFQPEYHFIQPMVLFLPQWLTGANVFGQLGFPHFALAAAGVVLFRRMPAVQVACLGYAAVIFGMTGSSALFWQIPIMRMAQFPWRLLALGATLQAFVGAAFFLHLPKSARIGAATLGITLAALFAWYLPQFDFEPDHKRFGRAELEAARSLDRSHRSPVTAYTLTNEFRPRTLRDPHAVPAPAPEIVGATPSAAIAKLQDSKPWRRRFRISAAAATRIALGQLYLPGWRIEIDGRPVPDAALRRNLRPDGLIRVTVPAGTHTLEAWYEGPVGWRYRNAAIVGILLGLVMLLVALTRRWRPVPTRRYPIGGTARSLADPA